MVNPRQFACLLGLLIRIAECEGGHALIDTQGNADVETHIPKKHWCTDCIRKYARVYDLVARWTRPKPHPEDAEAGKGND